MKKLISLLMVMSFVLAGCTSPKEEKTLKILAPSGAPALALASVYKDITKKGEIRIVEGSDLLSSELVKKESDYDAIIAPINLGCQLIKKGQTDYKLAAVLTWGNLYVIENEAASGQTLAAFGEHAVPGKILESVKNTMSDIKKAEVIYYNALSDVQAQVLAGKCRYAMMAEPAATATIAKAKQAGLNLKISASLQELYQNEVGSKEIGYPQAAIFVKNKEDVKGFLSQVYDFTNGKKDEQSIKSLIDEIKPETLGVPSSEIAVKTWENQNIHYRDAKEVINDIKSLLKQFNIEYTDDMLI